MKVVLISDNGIHHKKLTINSWFHIFLPLLVVATIGFFGISFVKSTSKLSSLDDDKAYENFNSVLTKLSLLDAEVQRLNTLNAHIASGKKININDYGLDKAPAMGGLIGTHYFESIIVRKEDINNSIKNIETDLEKQKLKLKNLVTSLEIKEAEEYLKQLYKPSIKKRSPRNSRVIYEFSTPLKKGYISSPYGQRKDPINGSLRHHSGLDIAAVKGSPVYAVANGFISFSGKKGAYGNLVEINHSESLKSRYAHLDKILTKKGQLVRKGDLIGKVGSTGRVTGPHLHLEIKENDKITNPKLYLNNALKNL